MSNIRAEVILSARTGISPGNHKYFASDAAALSFFRGKAVHTYSGVSVVRIAPSKHGYNVEAVHIKGTLKDFEGCEYVSYLNNDGSNRWFHCRISSVEFVNANSCRVYFSIDYYASYIGSCMGSLGRAFYVRGHVKKSEDTLGRYLLREPLDVPTVFNTDPSALAFTEPMNEAIKPDSYCVYSSSDSKQNTNTPEVGIKKQGGVELYGIIKGKTKQEVEEFIKSQTAQVSTFQSMTTPMMNNVQAIKVLPSKLVASEEYIHSENAFVPVMPSYKHKKMYSPQFFRWRIFALSSGSFQDFDITLGVDTSLSLLDAPVITFTFRLLITGGLNATASLYFNRLTATSPEDMDAFFIQHIPFPNIAINSYQTADYTTYGMIQKLALNPIGAGLSGAFTGTMVEPGAGTIAGGLLGAATSLGSGIADVWGQMPVSYHNVGMATTDMALAAKLYRFQVIRYSPSAGGLKTLESFFDTWGYVINENREVSLKERSNFTYIQTKNANVKGPAPAQALTYINMMLDGGVTIWAAEIGSTSDCGD